MASPYILFMYHPTSTICCLSCLRYSTKNNLMYEVRVFPHAVSAHSFYHPLCLFFVRTQ